MSNYPKTDAFNATYGLRQTSRRRYQLVGAAAAAALWVGAPAVGVTVAIVEQQVSHAIDAINERFFARYAKTDNSGSSLAAVMRNEESQLRRQALIKLFRDNGTDATTQDGIERLAQVQIDSNTYPALIYIAEAYASRMAGKPVTDAATQRVLNEAVAAAANSVSTAKGPVGFGIADVMAARTLLFTAAGKHSTVYPVTGQFLKQQTVTARRLTAG